MAVFEIWPKFKGASWAPNSKKMGAQPISGLARYTPNCCLVLEQCDTKNKTVKSLKYDFYNSQLILTEQCTLAYMDWWLI